jgi:hypothetical protein
LSFAVPGSVPLRALVRNIEGEPMIDRIKRDLPDFPDQVIDQWLEPLAKTDGWPPVAPRWKYLLGETDLGYWRGFKWQLLEVAFETIGLALEAESRIAGLIDAYLHGAQNVYARTLGSEGRKRFEFHFDYLTGHGQLILPPVLVESRAGLQVMDGYHRIAAYYVFKEITNFP